MININKETQMLLDEIEDSIDYNEKLTEYQTSNAPLEVRQKAIRDLQAKFPQFAGVSKVPSKELYKDIADSQADIPNTDY